jgi:hypothetical protein
MELHSVVSEMKRADGQIQTHTHTHTHTKTDPSRVCFYLNVLRTYEHLLSLFRVERG